MYKIAIIGAGQLGSRHLQGLTKSSKEFNAYVLDPDEKALSLSKLRYLAVSKPDSQNNVSFYRNISDLPKKLDLSIIATTANVRKSVVEALLENCKVKFLILEKVVFQKSDHFLTVKNLFNNINVRAWVNCTRRSYKYYKELKKEINGETLRIKVVGDNWGLACNSIHMIDLFVFLTDQTELVFNNSNLTDKIFSSKRINFKELKGALIVETKRGDILELVDSKSYKDDKFIINVFTKNNHFRIDEINKLSYYKSSSSNLKKKKINIPLQSQITGNILDQILESGESDLTPYNECMNYHIPMLNSFNEHFSKIFGKAVKTCPIT